MPTERRRPRRACADRAVDTHARRAVCAVCRVTSPRLLLSASHRRFGSVRAGTGDVERAPSRERVVVPTERRRPRRACADRAVDTHARRAVCAVCRVTSLRLLLSASHRRFGSVRAGTGDVERAPRRERVVVPTERRRPRRACADRAVDTRTRRFVRRVSSDITTPLALCVASPVRLCQSRHRRRRASAEPRASRRADRAPPTSSCVRRSRRRHTRAPCRVRRVSSDITAPLALCVASPVRLCQSRHRRRRASAEPRASRRADRAPPTSSCVRRSRRRHTHAPCRVRRVSSDITAPLALCVASPVRLCQSRHRRRRASAEPRASRRADRAPPTSSCVRRSRRRHTRAPCRVRRVSSDITAPLALCVASPVRLCQSRHRRRRASAEPRASRRADRAPPTSSCVRRSRRRHTHAPFLCAVCRVTSPRLLLSASHRRFGSVRAGTGDVERAPSRERVVVPTERRRPRRACADRAVDTHACRAVCAVCRVTSPRLLLSASHRRFGSVRAGTGDVERAPSRERVVVPTERRRPRRACADRAVDTHARRAVCAVCRVTSPRLLLSASHRRFGSVRAGTGDVERAPSRERVVVPTERRRPRRACADRAVDTRTRRSCAPCVE